MRLRACFWRLASLASWASSTILQNGQVRQTHFLQTPIPPVDANSSTWRTYGPNAVELSYKGRWDSKRISWWAAPGLKFGFTGNQVAITFGPYTSPDALIAFRVGGLDWQFTNVTSNSTHHLITPNTPGIGSALPSQLPLTFELRVTNWAYGVQIQNVHLASDATLIKLPNYSKTIEFIGDSLTSGMYATYEAFSGFGYNIGAGFGNVEFGITAYPGICLYDKNCFGNPRGQTYQWFQTSDTSPRASRIWGTEPEKWDFSRNPAADIVLINIGTNDNHPANGVSNEQYRTAYITFLKQIREVYPQANVIIMSLWAGFSQVGNSYREIGAFKDEIYQVYQQYKDEGWLHYFNSTGILQHNDIGPKSHPTDAGHIKIASHVLQYIRNKFGWEFAATGPEVQHETQYWNDETNY